MKLDLTSLGLLLIVSLMSCSVAAYVPEDPPATVPSLFRDPNDVVRIFLEAVERGELVVFEHQLDRSMIKPTRVEYIYDLNSTIPEVRVYCELKTPVTIPEHKDCELRAVSATVSADGRIIEVKAYIQPK